MDYSTERYEFKLLREELGPYLVDKTKLIVVNRRLTGHVTLVLRPRRCGKSTISIHPQSTLPLCLYTIVYQISSQVSPLALSF
jgi:hypothetical protein